MDAQRLSIRARWARTILLFGWAIAVLTGLALLTEFDTAPGAQGSPPRAWAGGGLARLDRNRPTLLMFAHPRCPCTRASIEELEQIVAACPGAANVQVLFRTPGAGGDDWRQTALWEKGAAIPGVSISPDPNGDEAARFGVKTSGHVLLFAAHGRLLFSGGITAARGHAGDNAGRSAICALISGGPAAASGSAVFGCELFEPSRTSTMGEACPAE